MDDLPLNIIDFIRHTDLLNDQSRSETQITVLKATYGLPLTEREHEIYVRGTGCLTYEEKEQREVTILAGRRGGKTITSSQIALFEAFREHGLPAGEEGYIMLLASTIDQAGIAFKYIHNYLLHSEILSKRIVHVNNDEIKLDNHIVIGCYACTYAGVRGRTIVAAICDEIAFWSNADDSANPVEEVLTALRPGMATVRNAKLIKISTPFAKSGVLWDEFQRRSELAFPVWQITTFEMNPTVTPEMVEPERLLSEEKFRREYLAQFTDSANEWLSPDVLNPCIVRDRRELPHTRDVNYFAAIDPASRRDDFALVILHEGPDGIAVMDRVARWTGTPKNPLQFVPVLGELGGILESYGINSVTGDQWCCDLIGQHLLKVGIVYNIFNISARTRTKLFTSLKFLIVQGKIEILDDFDLLKQLRNLREVKNPRGQIDVQPSSGHDDCAIALALAARELLNRPLLLTIESVPVDLRPSREPLRYDPYACPVAARCRNFPRCMDEGVCLLFDDDGTPC